MFLKKYNYLFILFTTFLLGSCEPWDDRIAATNSALTRNAFEEISMRSNLSKFTELLVKTGYDKVISASQNFTVWAPTNDALQSLDAAIINDATKLKAFVANHIANQAYYAKTAQRIKMLSGKYNNFFNKQLDVAKITEADQMVGNGVVHVLGGYVAPLQSIWEYVNATKSEYKQNDFVSKLNYFAFNPSTAIIDSISSSTGRPIYRPGTGIEQRNTFTNNVYDLTDESKEYTYIVLSDAALAAEVAKLNPYFKTSTSDSTYNQAAWKVVQDLALPGVYKLEEVSELLSKFNVRIPVEKNAIVKTIKLSNGVAYVMSKVDFKKEEKFKPLIVEGEEVFSRLSTTSSTATFIRERFNPVSNAKYRDIGVVGHGVTNYWLSYRLQGVPSMKYKVYWVAANDNVPTATVNQRLAMGTLASATFPFIAVPLNNFQEVLLGEYTTTSFGTLDMYLIANATNSLVLDYIKLVPVF
jgi:hypothetical protein